MVNRKCFKCGKELAPGELCYQFHMKMVAEFDGYLDADSPEYSYQEGVKTMQAAQELTAEQMSDDVYRERTFIFCRNCSVDTWDIVMWSLNLKNLR